MDDTSLSLLARLKSGPSEAAWRDVVELYAPLLDQWLARLGLQPADRDDVVQESLTFVVQRVGTFQHGGQGSFRAWLRAVLANRVREFWRRRNRHPQGTGDSHIADMLDQLEDPGSSLGRQWDAEHDRYVAHRLLARIAPLFEPATVAAFRGTVLDGQKPREVAAALGLTVNAVLIAKSRVLRELRREMGGMTELCD
ncbi:MAG: RNA polymerase sigma factor [Pirellulaceae bacterium]|nr:RNA polymerase sigma factor [Pirellulaceae bacterium]